MSSAFFVLFLVAGVLMLVFFRRSRKGIVSNFDPLAIRVIPSYGRRSDFSKEGGRDRNLAIICQMLAMVFAVLWWLTSLR